MKLYTHIFGAKLEISSMTSDAYKEAVLLAKEHILAVDIFQIVLSQRYDLHSNKFLFETCRSPESCLTFN